MSIDKEYIKETYKVILTIGLTSGIGYLTKFAENFDYQPMLEWISQHLTDFLYFAYFTWTTTIIIAWRFYVHWQNNKRRLEIYEPPQQKIGSGVTIPLEKRKFKAGEIVVASTMIGPRMTIVDYEGDRIRCRWFDNNESKTELFSESEITVFQKDERVYVDEGNRSNFRY